SRKRCSASRESSSSTKSLIPTLASTTSSGALNDPDPRGGESCCQGRRPRWDERIVGVGFLRALLRLRAAHPRALGSEGPRPPRRESGFALPPAGGSVRTRARERCGREELPCRLLETM